MYSIEPSNYEVFGGVLHDDGSVTPVPGSGFSDGTGAFTTGIIADREGHFIFVSSSGPEDHGSAPPSGTASFIINHADGSLALIAPILNQASPMGADPGGHFVYMLVPGGLDVFAVDQQTGALQRIPGSPFSGPTGSAPLITSAGTELFTVRSDNTIGAWRLNPQSGVPSVAPGSPFSVGDSHLSLGAITPDDRMLLVAGDRKIIAMRINDDGSLTSTASTPLSFDAGSFAVEPTGRFIYFCSGTSPNYLEGYSLDPKGNLTPVPGTPFDTKGCLALNANLSGKYLYASGGYLTYRIDQTTGALSRISQSVPNYGVAAVLTP